MPSKHLLISAAALATTSLALAGDPPARDAAAPMTFRPPAGESAKPSEADWNDATPIVFARPTALPCDAKAVREWVRVSCGYRGGSEHFGVRTLSGPTADVSIAKRAKREGEVGRSGRYGTDIIFPLRRGERRLIELSIVESGGFKSYTIEEHAVLVISAVWLEGEEPIVTIN